MLITGMQMLTGGIDLSVTMIATGSAYVAANQSPSGAARPNSITVSAGSEPTSEADLATSGLFASQGALDSYADMNHSLQELWFERETVAELVVPVNSRVSRQTVANISAGDRHAGDLSLRVCRGAKAPIEYVVGYV